MLDALSCLKVTHYYTVIYYTIIISLLLLLFIINNNLINTEMCTQFLFNYTV